MSTTPDTTEIEHLDFEIEKEESHWAHPVDPKLWWCGELKPIEKQNIPGTNGTETPASKITCVDCLHLYIKKGGSWWWKVNRAWYGR